MTELYTYVERLYGKLFFAYKNNIIFVNIYIFENRMKIKKLILIILLLCFQLRYKQVVLLIPSERIHFFFFWSFNIIKYFPYLNVCYGYILTHV